MDLRQPASAAAAPHTHPIADVVGLQAALDGKALLAHTHAIADTVGLQAALDAKAAAAHTHAQADVTGLVAALAGKSDTGHTHDASEVVSGVFAIARLATGAPSGAKFVRDDGTLAVPPGTGGGGSGAVDRAPAAGLSLAATESLVVTEYFDGVAIQYTADAEL